MKKLLVLVLFSSLVLAGCAQQGLSQSELFEKKQECASLQSEMLEQLQSKDWFKEQFIGEDKTKSEMYVKEFFYAPSRNSCLYTSDNSAGISRVFQLHDFFSKETIYEKSCSIVDDVEFKQCEQQFINEIQKLK